MSRPNRRLAIGLAIVVASVTDDGVEMVVRTGVGLRFVIALGLLFAAWRIGVRIVRHARSISR